jgi:F0F1-type ATP synthase beta subunit
VVKEAGEKAVGYAKNAGNFVVEKGKEIYNSETIQNFTHKAEEQYISLKEKAMNAIGNSNSNNTQ